MSVRQSWLVAVALSLVAVVVVFTRDQLGDYLLVASDDNAAPPIHLLGDGDVARAFAVMPAMGLVSILLRVPSAVVGGSDLLLAHRLGSLLCLLAVVALAVALDRRAARTGRPVAYRVALGLLLVGGPGVWSSFDAGHPEEYLGGALCVGAVLAATERRALTAAVLLGLALGTKQWAILAVVPTLLPIGEPRWLDRERLKAGAIAAAVAAVFVVPPIVASPTRYAEISDNLTKTQRVYPESIWYPIAPKSTAPLELGGGERSELTTAKLPLGLNRGMATFLAVLAAAGLALVSMRRGALTDPLGALTALLALRCIVDPMNIDYYAAPALIAVTAWEATRGPRLRLPLVSIVAAVVTYAVWTRASSDSYTLYWALWLAGTAPLLFVWRLGREDQAASALSGGSSPSHASGP